jgi:hypothetical protein
MSSFVHTDFIRFITKKASRIGAMQLAIWLTLSLFIGAFSASLAATEGGGLRDGTWGKKALRR